MDRECQCPIGKARDFIVERISGGDPQTIDFEGSRMETQKFHQKEKVNTSHRRKTFALWQRPWGIRGLNAMPCLIIP